MAKTTHPFLAACRREKSPYTPVWLMRQAGRYMEEYRKLRAEHDFLELCKNSELAAEITMTPVERLGVDAAIIFADILLALEPMGIGLEYAKNGGPVIHHPVRSGKDVDALKEFSPKKELSFVYETVKKISNALNSKVPLIGFAGAPFTLASYLIEGGGSRNYVHTKKLFYNAPEAWKRLMERLANVVTEYLNCQIFAGADAVQLFDSWAGCLTPTDYKQIRAAGGDVIGLDWRVNLDEAWKTVGYDIAIQGNLDPVALFASPKEIKARAADILRRAEGRPGHIFNLGHGVLPETPVDHVIALVDAVHELSSR
jgi:uroporphyrinogen decarboxylase